MTLSSSTNTMQVTLQVAQDFENWYLELEVKKLKQILFFL